MTPSIMSTDLRSERGCFDTAIVHIKSANLSSVRLSRSLHSHKLLRHTWLSVWDAGGTCQKLESFDIELICIHMHLCRRFNIKLKSLQAGKVCKLALSAGVQGWSESEELELLFRNAK